MRTAPLIFLASLLATAIDQHAFSQSSDADKAKAQALYDEGMIALEAKDYAAACPRFERATEIVPEGIGVKLMLAECWEGWGKLGRSYQMYATAEAEAKKAGQKERQNKAAARLKALEPKVAKLTITVASTISAPNLVITANGNPVPQQSWGSAIAIDAGQVVVRATSPVDGTFEQTVSAPAGRASSVTVDTLTGAKAEPAPRRAPEAVAPVTPAPPATDDSASEHPYSTAGWAVGSAGVAVLGVGIGLGVKSLLDAQDADEICPNELCPSQEAVDLSAQAQTFNIAGWVLTGVGAAATVAGVVLIALPAPSEKTTARLQLAPGHTAFHPTCNGSGFCSPNNEAVGFQCGSTVDTACTDPDTCDANQVCQANHAALGTGCNDTLFCTMTDSCNASGVCAGAGNPCAGGPDCADNCNEANDNCFDAGGTVCGNSSNTTCTDPDTCNATGTCLPNHVTVVTACTPPAGGTCNLTTGICGP